MVIRRLSKLLALVFASGSSDIDADSKRWADLTLRVQTHVSTMGEEALEMFAYVCSIENPLDYMRSFAQDEVNVPSCGKMAESGLEEYYGNVNFVLSEAWVGKVGHLLRHMAPLPAPLLVRPAADLLVVREPAESMLAGAIFVCQLLSADTRALSNAAIMIGASMPSPLQASPLLVPSAGGAIQPAAGQTIQCQVPVEPSRRLCGLAGIHRTPRHKMLRLQTGHDVACFLVGRRMLGAGSLGTRCWSGMFHCRARRRPW